MNLSSKPLLYKHKPGRLTINGLLVFMIVCTRLAAGQPAPTPQTSPSTQAQTTVKVNVNLVVVPVVVRDSAGHAVGDLRQDNFQILDNRKPQQISQFIVEKTAPRISPESLTPDQSQKFVAPNRFTAVLFDDLHLDPDSLPQLRTASLHFIAAGLARTERIAIFTTSGRVNQDFTDDLAKLNDAVSHLAYHPFPGALTHDCINISEYEANQIANRRDRDVKEAKVGEVIVQCGIKDPRIADAIVVSESERVLKVNDMQTQSILLSLSSAVDRLSTLPGQRTMVLASPSFVINDHAHREFEVIERAVRAHVIISVIDARGVVTDNSEIDEANVLPEFSDGTGGSFIQNTNNLEQALRRTASAPEIIYQLGFSPSDLKEDGKFHSLTVKLVSHSGLVVNARNGYFAHTHPGSLKEAENNAITDAVFTPGEIHELPIEMRTQFVQDKQPLAKLSVLTLVDIQQLPRHPDKNQNADSLRIIAAIFDHNGKHLGSIDRIFAVHWHDDKAGFQTAAKYDFLLDSGDYLVRLVVRDSESERLSSQQTIIQIPDPRNSP